MRYIYILEYFIDNDIYTIKFGNRSHLIFFLQVCINNGYRLNKLDIVCVERKKNNEKEKRF